MDDLIKFLRNRGLAEGDAEQANRGKGMLI